MAFYSYTPFTGGFQYRSASQLFAQAFTQVLLPLTSGPVAPTPFHATIVATRSGNNVTLKISAFSGSFVANPPNNYFVSAQGGIPQMFLPVADNNGSSGIVSKPVEVLVNGVAQVGVLIVTGNYNTAGATDPLYGTIQLQVAGAGNLPFTGPGAVGLLGDVVIRYSVPTLVPALQGLAPVNCL